MTKLLVKYVKTVIYQRMKRRGGVEAEVDMTLATTLDDANNKHDAGGDTFR